MILRNIHKYGSFLILAISLLFISSIAYAQTTAKKGVIDLSQYDLIKNGSIELNGEWEFYPNKLYTPKDFSLKEINEPKYVSVPSLWNSSYFPEKEKFNIGYGTYRLKIKNLKNIKLGALRLMRIETSYKIWVDSSLIISVGEVSDNKEQSVADQKTVLSIFDIKGPETDIIIQLSNFHHRKGGIDDAIIFGTPEEILKKRRRAGGYEFFIIGVLLIMGVFHLGLFFFGRKEYSKLFFSLLLFSEIISLMTNGEVLFTYLMPDLSWISLKRIDYISNFLRLSFFALFFYKLYVKYISRYFVLVLTILNAIMTVLVMLTELSLFSFTLFVFIITAAITLLYVLYAQFRTIIKRTEGSIIPFIGTLVLVLTAANDILFVADIIQTIYLVPFGLFIFIFSQSYILSFNFSNLYKKTEELNVLTSSLNTVKNELLQRTSFDLNESLEILVNKTDSSGGMIFSVIDDKAVMKSKFFLTEDGTSRSIYPNELIKKVTKSKESKIIQNTISSKYYEATELTYASLKSSICIPLIINNVVRAVLYLECTDKKHNFTEYHTNLFENLSDQIIGLIDNTNMYRELEDMNINLEEIISSRTKDIRKQRDVLEEQKDEIEVINTELKETLEQISQKNRIINESINFAKLTQQLNLPEEEFIGSFFVDSFIILKPKEELSGDFYWARKLKIGETEKIFFCVADCTGHGVPGALMSVIGNNLLNNVILNKKIHKPSSILNEIQTDIETVLGHESSDNIVKDGMDIAVVVYNQTENVLEYAGARIDLTIFRNGKATVVAADKISIGAGQHAKIKEKKFSNKKIQIKKNDIIYLFTDGFQDQFGGEKNTKFMKKNFRALLEEINPMAFHIQRSHLLKTLNKWQGDDIQNDDILVVGLKF